MCQSSNEEEANEENLYDGWPGLTEKALTEISQKKRRKKVLMGPAETTRFLHLLCQARFDEHQLPVDHRKT